mmetsp:Transcript_7736/g.19727  ORF Transcript_7736/g.19727 Transcript_7736/m.19727 type:complete len:205 (+) Transcript_7736:929-1543(+)
MAREGGASLVARRDREPGHLAEVGAELSRRFVRRDEDELHILATRLLHRLVALDQLWGERLARRAPVRGEVDGDGLALEVGDRHVVLVREELALLPAQQLVHPLRRPRELITLRILRQQRPAVGREGLAGLPVEQHKRRDARDLELLAQLRLHVSRGEGQRDPRLLVVVLVEAGGVSVRRDEDDLEALARARDRSIRLGKLGRE